MERPWRPFWHALFSLQPPMRPHPRQAGPLNLEPARAVLLRRQVPLRLEGRAVRRWATRTARYTAARTVPRSRAPGSAGRGAPNPIPACAGPGRMMAFVAGDMRSGASTWAALTTRIGGSAAASGLATRPRRSLPAPPRRSRCTPLQPRHLHGVPAPRQARPNLWHHCQRSRPRSRCWLSPTRGPSTCAGRWTPCCGIGRAPEPSRSWRLRTATTRRWRSFCRSTCAGVTSRGTCASRLRPSLCSRRGCARHQARATSAWQRITDGPWTRCLRTWGTSS
mmetsp:Transcript_40378/g.115373  ORF Transcript_40378/g.115373 Transcript_40378/m.115373 type:complete len:279 (+) Transcript_40378:94-930(+)